jgi:hypothetical protein
MAGADGYLVANVYDGPDCNIKSIAGSLKTCSSTEDCNTPGGSLRLRIAYPAACEESEQSSGNYKC